VTPEGERVAKGKARVRVAAVGDIHVSEPTVQTFRALLSHAEGQADIIALCGDLTNRGLPAEARLVADELAHRKVPILAVLGNHDYESDQQEEVTKILCGAGVRMLDDEPQEIMGVGFAGVKGFCGGFDSHELARFGESMIKRFVHESVEEALRLESGLAKLRTEHKVAVLHYAPVRDTVVGEPPEIFPFLGSSRLANPIDRFGVTVAIHGHAHHGAHEGKTATGIPVYNVAYAVMAERNPEQPYLVLDL
jgi:Icc-related predicted phosphoesterase